MVTMMVLVVWKTVNCPNFTVSWPMLCVIGTAVGTSSVPVLSFFDIASISYTEAVSKQYRSSIEEGLCGAKIYHHHKKKSRSGYPKRLIKRRKSVCFLIKGLLLLVFSMCRMGNCHFF
jgi:hypothetical protein